MNKLNRSFEIIEESKTDKGAYYASPSSDYSFVWLRDTFYISLAYLDKSCDTYEKAFYALLDYFREYEWKLDHHIKVKPTEWYEFMHIRYSAKDMKEVNTEWAHLQLDAYGCLLWGIAEGIKRGKKMFRDEKDKVIVQKIVWYLNTLDYANIEESGMWEEHRELRTSSIAACIAGLENVSEFVLVPAEMIAKGYKTLFELFPKETPTRDVDSALLSLIYPYNILPKPMAQLIIHNVEKELLKEHGCIRYKSDSYYSTLEKDYGRHQPGEFYIGSEAEWTMFLPWLSLCHQTLGNFDKAKEYIEWTERVMLPDGRLPELYYAKSNKYNPNTPLLWSNSLYIQAKEKYTKSLTQVN